MARAKLYIICGNCGCDDLFEATFDSTGVDVTEVEDEPMFLPEIYLSCRNCSTSHSLSDKMKISSTTSQT